MTPSQFSFLRREWAALFDAATRAEAAVHADPRTDEEVRRTLADLLQREVASMNLDNLHRPEGPIRQAVRPGNTHHHGDVL